ncbi:MAG TPA: response regulator [Polyangiaceae bacterium]|nr:response regulator [Polyangiaceae bacterium]
MTRLLVVDDDADILEALAVVLEDKHHVTTASNGLEALGLLQTESFDAMIIDLMMPLMDGETLILRMQDTGIAVPIVLASASQEASTLAARLGVEHISKPYEVATLEEKIARLIQPDLKHGTGE